jgi:phage-related protein
VPTLALAWYRSESGAEPVREWLRDVAKGPRQQIGADLLYVQKFWPTGMPRVRLLGGGLHELRSTFDGNEYRLFFCVTKGVLVALHVFQKKSQETPKRELTTARLRQKEVERG